MSYYDFSNYRPAARKAQHSKAGLLVAVIIAALVWGGFHLLWGQHTQPAASIAQTTIVSLPESDSVLLAEVSGLSTDSSAAPKFHTLVASDKQTQPTAD